MTKFLPQERAHLEWISAGNMRFTDTKVETNDDFFDNSDRAYKEEIESKK